MKTAINLWNPVAFLWDVLVGILKIPLKPIDFVIQRAATWANSESEKADSRWKAILMVSIILSVLSVWPFADFVSAVGLVIFVLVHEKFHDLVATAFGVAGRLITILFLGAAVILDTEKFNSMPHWGQALVFVAGPIGSLAVGILLWILGLVAQAFSLNDLGILLLRYANFNMLLVLFNVLVFGALDGGRLFKVVYASLREQDEKFVMIPVSIVTVIAFWVFFINTWNFEIFLLIPLLVAGYFASSFADDPKEAHSPRRMSYDQVIVIVTIYVMVMIIAAFLYPQLPGWISLLHAP